jgi:lantibiotic modifying enzyme
MAGVIYFLLAVYETIPDPDLLSAACAGLQYLESRAERSGSALYWPTGAKGGQPDPWLEHGVTGIALPFIKAYAITGETRYKEIATTILLGHGDRLVTPFLSIASGAAGIGIAYISAWQAFKEAVWKERAAWIVQLLLNTVQPQRDGTLCWSADNSSLACGDLLVGNTGIIHFLMRYLDPGITPLSLFI